MNKVLLLKSHGFLSVTIFHICGLYVSVMQCFSFSPPGYASEVVWFVAKGEKLEIFYVGI